MPRRQAAQSDRDGLTSEQEIEFVYEEDSGVSPPGLLAFTGLPISTISEPYDTDEELTTSYSYSALGQVEEISVDGLTVDGLQTRRKVIQYSPGRVFPVRTIDDRGHEVDLLHDEALGAAISTSEEGRPGTTVQRFAYVDGFGRLRRTYDPDGTVTNSV